MSGNLGDAPPGEGISDNSYVSRSGHKAEPLPVQSDDTELKGGVDPTTADSDEQLARDDNEAIDSSNIMSGRTRGAKPATGYREPGDEEGIPANDGTSSAN